MEAFGLPEPSPQLAATSYGRGLPYIDRSQYVEAQAELLPQLYLQKKQEEAFNERLRIEREAREQARRDANITLGIKGAELGYQVATNPTLQRYGKGVLEALKPKPWQAPATNLAPMNYMQAAPSGGTPLNMPIVPDVVPTEMALPNVDTFRINPQGATFATTSGASGTAPVMATTQSSAPSLMSKVTGYKGIAPFESGAANAGLKMGLGAVANYGIKRSNMGEFMHKTVGGGEKEWDLATTSISSLVLGGLPGLGMNLAFHGIKEFGKKNCIIVTTACGKDSKEVQIAREYRDKYMSHQKQRGYYYLADRIVPIMEKCEEFKKMIKENLVEPLIRFGEWRLGYSIIHPSAMDCAIVKNFLLICEDIGNAVGDEYIRDNGEVI